MHMIWKIYKEKQQFGGCPSDVSNLPTFMGEDESTIHYIYETWISKPHIIKAMQKFDIHG